MTELDKKKAWRGIKVYAWLDLKQETRAKHTGFLLNARSVEATTDKGELKLILNLRLLYLSCYEFGDTNRIFTKGTHTSHNFLVFNSSGKPTFLPPLYQFFNGPIVRIDNVVFTS